MTTLAELGLSECKESCESAEGCKGFVWSEKKCKLLEGSVKIKKDKEGIISGIMPCP